MRWHAQETAHTDLDALSGLDRIESLSEVTHEVRTPGFADLVYHEVLARSALNRVPDASSEFPGAYTINPYRGCSHACTYCFARGSHRYLDFDTGHDFDTQIVVKTNIVERLHHELRTSHVGRVPFVMLGSNTDPYQRCEGRYALMPGIYRELAQAGIGFSVLTKGTLIRRDLPLLSELATQVPVSVSMSIPIVDDQLRQQFEPGTPSAQARLRTVSRARDLGLDVGVFLMPILPLLTDSRSSLMHTLQTVGEAGAHRVLYQVLHLRSHVRPWFMRWLREYHPDLVDRYTELYPKGDRATSDYRRHLAGLIKPLISLYRLDGSQPGAQAAPTPRAPRPQHRRAAKTRSRSPLATDASAVPTLF